MCAPRVLVRALSGERLLHGWNRRKLGRPTRTLFRWLAGTGWENLARRTIGAPLDTHPITSIYVYTVKQEGKLIKVSMNFPPSLWKELQYRALEENTTVTAIMVRLAKEYLSKRRPTVKAK